MKYKKQKIRLLCFSSKIALSHLKFPANVTRMLTFVYNTNTDEEDDENNDDDMVTGIDTAQPSAVLKKEIFSRNNTNQCTKCIPL